MRGIMNAESRIMQRRRRKTHLPLSPRSPRRGFTLLFSVLIGSLLFSLGATIAHLSTRGIALSAAGKESEAAFFAADTGIECALYWDLRVGNTFPNSTEAPRDPDGRIKCNGNENITLTFSPVTASAATTKFQLPLSYGCAYVTVEKTASPERVVIESRGRNECGTGVNPARVERALRVRY